MTKIISIGTIKGGVGKTCSAITIASILTKEFNHKLLLIDADPQSNTTSYLKLDTNNSSPFTIKDIFENPNIAIEDIIQNTDFENLDIIKGSILMTATEMKLVSIENREFVFKNYLERNKEFLEQYAYVLIDTSPGVNVTNQNIFCASDSIVLVSDVSAGSYKGVELFNLTWNCIRENLTIAENIKGLIITKIRRNTNLSKIYLQFLKENDLTKSLMLNANISDSVKLAEAELNRTPINFYAPNCKSSKEYHSVVDELIERGVL